jgi:tRNA threonylcarbamoyladenosine biosynthesis protein TsaE
MKRTLTHSEEETTALGTSFAKSLRPGDVIALFGDLGSGKTRFVQGVCRGLGVKEHVASPTFTIVNEYLVGTQSIYHFDFYRITSLAELREIGFEEYLSGNGICLIEWADRVRDALPQRRYDVHMTLGSDDQSREIVIEDIVGVPA